MLGLLNDEQWSLLRAAVLRLDGVGVVACDDTMLVADVDEVARSLLAGIDLAAQPGDPLPAALAGIARGALEGRLLTVRLSSAAGNAALWARSASIPAGTLAAVAIWLHAEVLRDPELSEALRNRYGVSTRDFQLIEHLRAGCSTPEIARRLGLKASTVRSYFQDLFETLGVHSRPELLALVERIRCGR